MHWAYSKHARDNHFTATHPECNYFDIWFISKLEQIKNFNDWFLKVLLKPETEGSGEALWIIHELLLLIGLNREKKSA